MSLNRNNPGVSSLLLSEPFMLDPNFQRSVVLLCEHDPQQGTLGYIVNQPTGLTIGDLIGELSGCDLPLFVGGPVEQNTLHFVHKYGALIPDGTELGRGLYWGGDFDEIKHLLSSGVLTSNDIKFFIGAKFFLNHVTKNVLQDPDHRRPVDVFLLCEFSKRLN